MSQVFYTRHSGGITLFMNGKPSTVSSAAPQFENILEALKAKDFAKVEKLMSLGGTITALGVSRKHPGQKIFVKDGKVFHTDSHKVTRELHGALVTRILSIIGKPMADKYADALMNFLDNVMKNKVKDIREELYEFLASGKTPITRDGCFLAYKKVRHDFKDGYTGKMDNSPGTIVRIPQEKVDRDRNRTCSVGLHFASKDYLSAYGAGPASKVVIVKVNPRHVFAIPTDYNCQKGRASEYYVVGEYTGVDGDAELKDAFNDSFIDELTAKKAAPNVKFASSLNPSLETKAASYGLLQNHDTYKSGAVLIIYNSRGQMFPVKYEGKKLVDIQGNQWVLPPGAEPELMSVKTNSVREALKRAIAKVSK